MHNNSDLPMLILEFASFKPKKGNYANKLSEEARDKIETILSLVSDFKYIKFKFSKNYCR